MNIFSARSKFLLLILASILIGKSAFCENADDSQVKLSARVVTIFDKVPLTSSLEELAKLKPPLGSGIKETKLFAARNSFASFNLLITALPKALSNLSIRFAGLSSNNGEVIKNKSGVPKDLFNFRGRAIELFLVRYLEIKGLSKLSYEAGYDERHVPIKFRRPWSGEGVGRGSWKDRPHANAMYPEILVPIEKTPTFSIDLGHTQSVLGDIYISNDTAPGLYKGEIEILHEGKTIQSLPVELEVFEFALRDASPAAAMVYLETSDIAGRYLGERYPQAPGQQANLTKIVDNHFKLARRHGIDLFDKNEGLGSKEGDAQPRTEWLPRLNGALFSPQNGYEGPGEGIGQSIFFIGTYGNWPGKQDPEVLSSFAKRWQEWFKKNSPQTEVFFYLIDESSDWPQQETWAKIVRSAAPQLKTFATVPLPEANDHLPSLQVAASWFNFGSTARWEKALTAWRAKGKDFILYNGRRPLTGSFATEDEGVALRVLAWSQVKVGVKRWFFWNGTYYTNFQGGTGDTNVFKSAHTFGGNNTIDPSLGQTGWNHSNGDGVLFYPGTDRVFPAESLSLDGPLASLRLKLWRAGIEDAKYIELAFEKNPNATKAIMQKILPRALWQYGVSDESDPTWKKTDISWSVDPEDWEKARRELAGIIMAK